MKKPIIIHQDLEKITQLYSSIEEAIPFLQRAWDAFKESKFFNSSVALSYLIANHENLKFQYKMKVASKLTPVPEGLGVEVDETDAVKRYKVPTPELDQAINQVKEVFDRTGINYSYFGIKSDKVIVNDQAVAKLTARHTIAAETDREIEFYKQANSFINAATKLDKFLKSNRIDQMFLIKLHPIQISRWLVMDEGKYKINPQVFRRISKQLARLEVEE